MEPMNRFRRIDFASLCSLAARNDKIRLPYRCARLGIDSWGSLKGLQIRTLFKKLVVLGWQSVGGVHDVTLDHTIYVMTGIERPIIY
jgi:hypothetical protein